MSIKPDDYAKLHYSYHEDTDLAIIADLLDEEHAMGWLVFLYWPRMIAKAKQAKTFGWFETTPRSLALSVHDNLASGGTWAARARMWELFSTNDLIRIRQGVVEHPSEKLDVLVVEYEKWQAVSNKEKQKLKRERAKAASGQPVHWTVRHWAEFAFTPIAVGVTDTDIPAGDTERAGGDTENGVTDTVRDETKQYETSAAPVSPSPLSVELRDLCSDAARLGPRAEWWESSVQKLRHRHASAPDSVFTAAIDWMLIEAEGQLLGSARAWRMLDGAVRHQADRRKATEAKSGRPMEVGSPEWKATMLASLGSPETAA